MVNNKDSNNHHNGQLRKANSMYERPFNQSNFINAQPIITADNNRNTNHLSYPNNYNNHNTNFSRQQLSTS